MSFQRLFDLVKDAQRDHGTVNGNRSCGPFAYRKKLRSKLYMGSCIRCEARKKLKPFADLAEGL